MDWLRKIPGYRSAKLIPMIASTLGYFMVILMMTMSRPGLVFGLAILSLVLFFGNVGRLKETLPPFNHSNPWIRRGAAAVLIAFVWYAAATIAYNWDPAFFQTP